MKDFSPILITIIKRLEKPIFSSNVKGYMDFVFDDEQKLRALDNGIYYKMCVGLPRENRFRSL